MLPDLNKMNELMNDLISIISNSNSGRISHYKAENHSFPTSLSFDILTQDVPSRCNLAHRESSRAADEDA